MSRRPAGKPGRLPDHYRAGNSLRRARGLPTAGQPRQLLRKSLSSRKKQTNPTDPPLPKSCGGAGWGWPCPPPGRPALSYLLTQSEGGAAGATAPPRRAGTAGSPSRPAARLHPPPPGRRGSGEQLPGHRRVLPFSGCG